MPTLGKLKSCTWLYVASTAELHYSLLHSIPHVRITSSNSHRSVMTCIHPSRKLKLSFDLKVISKAQPKIELYRHSILIIQSYETHTHTHTHSERETNAHPLTTSVSNTSSMQLPEWPWTLHVCMSLCMYRKQLHRQNFFFFFPSLTGETPCAGRGLTTAHILPSVRQYATVKSKPGME